MKILFCTNCWDVLALRAQPRNCLCGKSVDRLNVEISGPCFVRAFLNGNFSEVVRQQMRDGDLNEKLTLPPYEGHTRGREFMAFIVPENAPAVQ